MLQVDDYQNHLPESAYLAVRDSLLGLGFDKNAILRNQKISLSENNYLTLDALAFAHPIRRRVIDTCFTLYNAANGKSDEELVTSLALSGAPFHLLHRNRTFTLWTSPTNDVGQIRPVPSIPNITYDKLNGVFQDHADDLAPERILDFKQHHVPFFHFPELSSIQMSLFTQEVTGKLLRTHFSSAVAALRAHDLNDETVSKLAIQLLAIVVLADTGALTNEIRLNRNDYSIHDLIREAKTQSFGRFFDERLFEQHPEAIEASFRLLRQLHYANFDPNLIPELQLSAYTINQRKQYGLYDTPLYLTRYIWDAIPVEFLPPEERHVADMTCGWGSFLISGHQRLSSLTDSLPLQKFLHGNDNYGPTYLWAGLGLILSTFEDSWHIDHEDGLKWRWLNDNAPNIIVGNPPYSSNKKIPTEDRIPKAQGKLHELAYDFLNHAIKRLAPSGYIAMIVPQSFGVSQSGHVVRQQFLKKCDILELWDLPKGVFEGSANTLVLIAQKRGSLQRFFRAPTRIRSVQRQESLQIFENTGVFTASGIVVNQSASWNENSKSSKNNTHIMNYPLILSGEIWDKIIASQIPLIEKAIIFNGATKGKKDEKKRWRDYNEPKLVNWLTKAKEVIPHRFFIDYTRASKITYPNDLKEPLMYKRNPKKNKTDLLKGKKVLLTAGSNASWGRRVTVAIERHSHYVSNSFWVIVPTKEAEAQGITHEVIAAVLDWYVSNAWIVEHLKYTWIPRPVLETLPFPKQLSESDCKALTEAVHHIEAAANHRNEDPLEARKTIDTILKGAYQLDEKTLSKLRSIYHWEEIAGHVIDPSTNLRANWQLSGIVENVDAQNGLITVWTDEFDEPLTIPIHPAMPGWMLREEAAFRVKIPYEQAEKGFLDPDFSDWGRFTPQPNTYLTENELLEKIFDTFEMS